MERIFVVTDVITNYIYWQLERMNIPKYDRETELLVMKMRQK